MTNVETGKELKLSNVLSLRKKLSQQDISFEMIEIGKFLMERNITKTGPIVTVTYAIENQNGQPILDMEMLVPIDRNVDLPDKYKFKPLIHLVNAVYARHQGNPSTLQNTYNDIMAYIQNNRLHQITSAYNVQVNDMTPGRAPEDLIIDVYIGINPSVL